MRKQINPAQLSAAKRFHVAARCAAGMAAM